IVVAIVDFSAAAALTTVNVLRLLPRPPPPPTILNSNSIVTAITPSKGLFVAENTLLLILGFLIVTIANLLPNNSYKHFSRPLIFIIQRKNKWLFVFMNLLTNKERDRHTDRPTETYKI